MSRFRRKNRWAAPLKRLMIAAALVCLLIYTDASLKPVAESIMSSQSVIMCTRAVNEAVIETMSQENCDYSQLVTIERNAGGEIVGLTADSARLNLLKARLTNAVNERLDALEEKNVSIPLGTLTGWQWLSGRGPGVTMKMVPAAYADSKLVNRFDSAGINQTRHQIMIVFDIKLYAILAPYSISIDVPAEVSIAETVIVGAVPEMFAGITPEILD